MLAAIRGLVRDEGDWLAIGAVSVLALMPVGRRMQVELQRRLGQIPLAGSAATVDDLERALRSTRRGSRDVGTRRRKESPHVTFLRMNASDVPDHLLVAVLLAGAVRADPVDAAQDLLHRAGGDLGTISRSDLIKATPGAGPVARARLAAAAELYRRAEYRGLSDKITKVKDAVDAVRLLRSMAWGPYERLVAIYLDRRRRVLATRVLSQGSDGFTIVDPRQVFQLAVEIGASAVILAHQHPSGDPRPSSQDLDVTERVGRAGRVLGISLLDHIVVVRGGGYTSLAEEGYIR
jgi:DNA repair protein RadC